MPKIRITQAAADKVSLPKEGRVDYFDRHLPAFGLRVSATGAKSWFVFGRVGGKLKRFTIASFDQMPKVDEARDAARAIQRELAAGRDPAAKPAAAPEPDPEPEPPLTFRALAEDFIERHSKVRNKAWRGTKRLLENHVLPEWGDRPAASIRKRDVLELLDGLTKKVVRGEPMAQGVNRVLAAIRKLFNWAAAKDILETAPTDHVEPLFPENERDRVLTDPELAAVWRASEALAAQARAFVRLLILSAQRRSETAAMRWPDLDPEAKVWTIKRAATKGDRSHEVPLSDLACEVIAEMPRVGTYVLTARRVQRKRGEEVEGGEIVGKDAPLSGFSKIKAALDAKIAEMVAAGELSAEGAAMTTSDEDAEAHWTFHDLRRSAGTGIARMGNLGVTVGRVLNHSESGVTKIYNRYGYLSDKRAALDAWAAQVRRLIEPAPDNVVELKRPA